MARLGRKRLRHGTLGVIAVLVPVCLLWSLSEMAAGRRPFALRPDLTTGPPYATLAQRSMSMLEHKFYNGSGRWHMCVPPVVCNTKNSDWGADSLTYDLYLRWQTARDRTVLPLLATLAQTAVLWYPGRVGSSDNMMWDAVAEARVYQATGSSLALVKSEAALARLNAGPASGWAGGACPAVSWPWPFGSRDYGMKTLETDSNYVKAALLLYQITRHRAFLSDAELRYAAIRRYYLSPSVGMYSDLLFDNGHSCVAVPGIFLGSSNGNMIWAGATLAADTGNAAYLRQAITTARAVSHDLSDGAGVYNGLLADIDIGEPLVEAMYKLATTDHQRFARTWLLTAASAAAGDVNAQQEFGRFYDGPPPAGEATAWAVNGGVALMTAAAALDPAGRSADPGFWKRAVWVPDDVALGGAGLPTIQITGQAIAIIGTIGDVCCSSGHADVLVDGVPTVSRVGIWQNRTSPARRQPDQVLFAWRWQTAGPHTITILPGIDNTAQGGAYFHMTGYFVVP